MCHCSTIEQEKIKYILDLQARRQNVGLTVALLLHRCSKLVSSDEVLDRDLSLGNRDTKCISQQAACGHFLSTFHQTVNTGDSLANIGSSHSPSGCLEQEFRVVL